MLQFQKNLSTSLESLRELRNNKKFEQLCDDIKNTNQENYSVEDILMYPSKRIKEYQTSLNELLKITPKDHYDYEQLVTITSTIDQTMEEIDKVRD